MATEERFDLPSDSTFSILAVDQANLEVGVAITTCRPAVGNRCILALAGVGAVATQAQTNPYVKHEALSRLLLGEKPEHILQILSRQDPQFEYRQIALVDFHGNAATVTGSSCQPYASGYSEHGLAVIGNILTGPEVLTAMIDCFRANSSLRLAQRLLKALQAGEKAGGDRRGKQSAAIMVSKVGWYPYIDLRVDDSPEPCRELERLLDMLLDEVDRLKTEFPHLGARILGKGSVGVDVVHAAYLLRELGYYSAPGVSFTFDDQLENSTRQFQLHNGLDVTGVLDTNTIAKLRHEFLINWREKRVG